MQHIYDGVQDETQNHHRASHNKVTVNFIKYMIRNVVELMIISRITIQLSVKHFLIAMPLDFYWTYRYFFNSCKYIPIVVFLSFILTSQ